jgi:RecG-like helicase
VADIHDLTFDQQGIATLKSTAYTKDWPVVYLLEDGKEAYVGETVSAYNRLRQHARDNRREKLRDAHIIIDDEFNKSASLDIESWLIQYMAADERFTLQNGNKGLYDHSYYDREKYRAKFEVLWSELQKKGLARKDLLQLRNSELFKYSPYKALTDEQDAIVRTIEADLIRQDYCTYVINGEPGTGKSVLATYLAKYLIES